jgi:hypothetical protein
MQILMIPFVVDCLFDCLLTGKRRRFSAVFCFLLLWMKKTESLLLVLLLLQLLACFWLDVSRMDSLSRCCSVLYCAPSCSV